ncbi:MAG TPA: hypothetical protein VHW96_24345 [Solirubrobacteraceae bacterium]|jgi:hypothetical protein|nr:hypothetical protein [Solirubrobacteraceae bacterium]
MSPDQPDVKPSEQRGGATPGGDEAREKGEWAATAQDGIVPARLGGSDAAPEMLDDDPELGSSVLGETTASDEPATDTGVDTSGGEHADAVTDGGSAPPPPGAEPDLKDATAGPREPDRESADG